MQKINNAVDEIKKEWGGWGWGESKETIIIVDGQKQCIEKNKNKITLL